MSVQEQNHPIKRDASSGGGPSGGADAVYGLGVIGAWVFYFKRADTTEARFKAFLKGLVWPAFLVHDLLVFLERESRQS